MEPNSQIKPTPPLVLLVLCLPPSFRIKRSYPPRKNGNGFSIPVNSVEFLFFDAPLFVCGEKILFNLQNMPYHFFSHPLNILF